MIPLPSGGNASGNVRVRANRFGSMDISRGGSLTTPTEKNESSATALANDGSDPWSLGSQTNITSIRRGTYFGEFLVWNVGGVVGVVVWLGWCFLLLFLTCFFSSVVLTRNVQTKRSQWKTTAATNAIDG
jgi:hypothetical protein